MNTGFDPPKKAMIKPCFNDLPMQQRIVKRDWHHYETIVRHSFVLNLNQKKCNNVTKTCCNKAKIDTLN